MNLMGQNVAPQPIPYCESINASNIGSYDGEHLGYFCYDISKNTTIPTNVYSTSAQGLSLKPKSHVHIYDGTHIKPTGNSQFTAKIVDPGISAAWFEPNGQSGYANLNQTMELGFMIEDLQIYIDNGILNPYDPDELDLQVETINPYGVSKTQYGFYYEPYEVTTDASGEEVWTKDMTSGSHDYSWRFRFAPNYTGFWTYKVKLTANINGIIQEYKMNLRIECGWSDHKGRLVVTPGNKYLKYSHSNDPFFAIGNGVSKSGFYDLKPDRLDRWLNGVQDLVDVGANYTRFDLEAQGALPDWPNVLDNPGGIKPPNVGDYSQKQDEMYAFDKVLEKCEVNNIYYTIFRHHVEVFDYPDSPSSPNGKNWDGVSWMHNPYKNQFGYTNYVEYFNDTVALEYHLKTLRYICARWGYSPNFAFYGFSELETWLNYQTVNWHDLYTWIGHQKNHVKNELKYDFGFVSSFGTKYKNINTNNEKTDMDNFEFNLYNSQNDVVHRHVYGESKNVNYKNRFDQTKGFKQLGAIGIQDISKPVLIEEMGYNENKGKIFCCTKLDYHNSIWSTAMMGGYGAGLDWWWDKGLHSFGYHHDLANLRVFFEGEDLFHGNYEPNRWSDATVAINRIKEAYYLVRGDKSRVLGWANNATSYWRNLEIEPGDCVNSLVNSGLPGIECLTTDGDENIDNNPSSAFYNNVSYDDPLGDITSPSDKALKIKGLKSSSPFNPKYYLIELHTTEGAVNSSYFDNGIVKTNLNGTLYFKWWFTKEAPDVAFKMTYLEGYEGVESQEIDTIIDFTNHNGSDRSKELVNESNSNRASEYDEIRIFPNPSDGLLYIKAYRKKIGKVRLIDIYGNLILEKYFDGPDSHINIEKLANGVYFLYSENKKYKIIKSD